MDLDDILIALADGTRRSILKRLASGDELQLLHTSEAVKKSIGV